jgi:hypothetical protein
LYRHAMSMRTKAYYMATLGKSKESANAGTVNAGSPVV